MTSWLARDTGPLCHHTKCKQGPVCSPSIQWSGVFNLVICWPPNQSFPYGMSSELVLLWVGLRPHYSYYYSWDSEATAPHVHPVPNCCKVNRDYTLRSWPICLAISGVEPSPSRLCAEFATTTIGCVCLQHCLSHPVWDWQPDT